MSNERMTDQEIAAELEAFAANFDPEVHAARVEADRQVAPRGFTVRRHENETVVEHNRSTETFTFTRGSDSYRWSCRAGHGHGHRSSGQRTFEFHDRVVVTNPGGENDPEVRAVAWFRAAEANGEAFSE